jgi:hypothetical protein
VSDAYLHARQTRLLQRSAVLRVQAQQELIQLAPSFALADRVVQAGKWLRSNPLYAVAALATCVVLKPRAAWRMAIRGWSLWQRWQTLRQLIPPGRGADPAN